ncbi:MAG: hypothetical protein JWO38_3960 [Gemmataceae bacterium]|nr:hypothetical protein [Gemmataceae bacterium]
MTWLGKILAVLVMILAVVWMWFTVTVFVARTNWKTQAEQFRDAYEKARAARTTEYESYRSEKDALDRQLVTERTRNETLVSQVKLFQADSDKITKRVGELEKAYQEADVKATELAARLQSALEETDKARSRASQLEDERVKLVIAKENAEKDRQAAQNESRQAQAEKLAADQRVETLTTQVNELRASGGRPEGIVKNSFAKPPAALPDGVRGTVTGYKDGYMAVSIGIDAGLTNGAILDVYRADDGGHYLGTVVISRVYPKEAVGTFKPGDPLKTIARLRPEELPKVGDTVGKIGNVSAGR